MVYVDPKVQPPLPKLDMTKTPQKSQKRPKRHYKSFSKQSNTPKASIIIVVRIGNRLSAELPSNIAEQYSTK